MRTQYKNIDTKSRLRMDHLNGMSRLTLEVTEDGYLPDRWSELSVSLIKSTKGAAIGHKTVDNFNTEEN